VGQHTNRGGLLHKARRAVIFQVIRKQPGLGKEEYAVILGISPNTLETFLVAEGFQCTDEVQGAYPADLEALKEVSDIGLEDNRVTILEQENACLTKLIENLQKLHKTYAAQMGHLAGVRHRNQMLLRQLKESLNRQCLTCNGRVGLGRMDPTPAEIAEQCKEIRATREAEYARHGGFIPGKKSGEGRTGDEPYEPKLYKLRTSNGKVI
jgi:hypothetical protein